MVPGRPPKLLLKGSSPLASTPQYTAEDRRLLCGCQTCCALEHGGSVARMVRHGALQSSVCRFESGQDLHVPDFALRAHRIARLHTSCQTGPGTRLNILSLVPNDEAPNHFGASSCGYLGRGTRTRPVFRGFDSLYLHQTGTGWFLGWISTPIPEGSIPSVSTRRGAPW